MSAEENKEGRGHNDNGSSRKFSMQDNNHPPNEKEKDPETLWSVSTHIHRKVKGEER